MVISGAANALFILKSAARGICQERSLPLRMRRGGVRRTRQRILDDELSLSAKDLGSGGLFHIMPALPTTPPPRRCQVASRALRTRLFACGLRRAP